MAVCEALADFADLRSASRGPHSHTVASLAARAAAHLGLSQAEQDRLLRAGLVHDLGKIAVPYRLLERARWAGGCTSGHGLSGCAAGSPDSLAATATFFAVAVAVTFAARALSGGAL
jgi:HD domain